MRIIHYLLISTALSLPVAYGMDGEQENQNYVNQNAELNQLKKERNARSQEKLRQQSQDIYNTRSNTDNPFVRLAQEAGNSSQPQQQEDTITLSEETQPDEASYSGLGVLPADMLMEIINNLGQNERLNLRLVNKSLNDLIRLQGNIRTLRFSDEHFKMLDTQIGHRYKELFPDAGLENLSPEEPENYEIIKEIAADIWSQIFTLFPTIDTLDLGGLLMEERKNDLISLATLPQIKNLNMGNGNFDDENSSVIARYLPNLTQLTILGCHNLTDQGLVYLSTLRNLTHLTISDLNDSMITRAGILALANLINLTELRLVDSILIPNWIEALSSLTNLRRLNLWGSTDMITDAKLPELVNTFPNLTYLGIGLCDGVTDAGLQQLAELKDLKELDVSGNMEITEDGLNSLRMQLPNLKIINDN